MRAALCIAAAFLFLGTEAQAFHDGGVGSCQGCHVMHQSEDGLMVPGSGELLRGSSATDICLSCHADANGAVFGVDPLFPDTEYGGGNFIFLLEDNINDRKQGTNRPIPGEAAGHSIVAPGAGLMEDSRWASAPGGSFSTASLGCTSCHDPHGNTNYRMLYGVGDVQGGLFYFSAGAPVAEGVSLSGAAESPSNHTAYQSGWSQWCGNCHGVDYHDVGNGRFDHPTDDALESSIANRYGVYLGDANPTGGSPGTSYLPQVPFQDPSLTSTSTAGPAATSRLSCMSCHRAHASSAPAAGRWDWNVDQLGDDGVVSGSWVIPDPYNDPAQRSLCVKCHDENHDNGKSCLNCHAPGQGSGTDPFLPAN